MLGSLVSRRRQNRSTFHEPGSAGIPVGGLPVCVSPARTPAFPGTDGFKVPMHGTKVVGAFHGPYEFRVRAPIESGVGPPHSTTLARWPRPPELPPGFGVRRPCGALEFPGRFTVPMRAGKRIRASPEPAPTNPPLTPPRRELV